MPALSSSPFVDVRVCCTHWWQFGYAAWLAAVASLTRKRQHREGALPALKAPR
jgi:hypothetical protein